MADKLLQRPLYIFDLPEELLYSLQLRSGSEAQSTEPERTQAKQLQISETNGSDSEGAKSATSCALCNLWFADLQEQRSHIRSDLHGYNLKQKLRGKPAVEEAEFDRMVGQLDESISGSDTSDSDDSDDGDILDGAKPKESTLSALLKRQAKVHDGDADDAPSKNPRGAGKPPMLYLQSSKLPSNTSLGVYRAIFSNEEQAEESHLVETIQRKQLAAKPAPPPQKQPKHDDEGGVPLPSSMIASNTSIGGPHYFLCMIGGGHFAAMLVSLTPKLTRKAGAEDRTATVIAHKTFHRYTTRRKQGGSQSANDNAKGAAHSAGSTLRRYNEAALIQDVRNLLQEWKSWIDTAELLFVRATGSTNRRTLFGPYENQVLTHKDPRLRGFPFSTRRATQSELMRSFVELTRVKVHTIDEAELARQQAATEASLTSTPASPSPKPTPTTPKLSKADEALLHHTTQLQALIRRSKAPALATYLTTNTLSPNFPFSPPDAHHHAPTPLHLAAASNSPACITTLLLKLNADPTIPNPEGKTAFDIAGDRPTRDAFRLARSHLGDAHWSWEKAHVPAALSQSDVDARSAREKAEQQADDAAEKQRRQAEVDRIRKQDAEREDAQKEKKFGKGHSVLGSASTVTAEERRMQEARGMTEEMRMRLEREKRARAAEERMRRLQGK